MSEPHTLPLYPYQRKIVEDIVKAHTEGVPIVLNIGRREDATSVRRHAQEALARLHRTDQPEPRPPTVLVIDTARIGDDITATLRAKLATGGFVVIDEPPLPRTLSFSEIMGDSLFELALKACAEPDPVTLPAIRAQRIKPMKGSASAQWKRERNGRGRR